MNKLRTARIHLVRFLFILPLLSVLLLAFRSQWDAQTDPVVTITAVQERAAQNQVDSRGTTVTTGRLPGDTLPRGGVNKKGYMISVTDIKGTVTVVVKDSKNAVVKKISIAEWNSKPEYYEGLYGALPPPPPPSPPPAKVDYIEVQGYPIAPAAPISPVEAITVVGQPLPAKAPADVITVQGHPSPATAPAYREVVVTGYAKPSRTIAPLPENVESILVKQGNKIEVLLKNGKKEYYDLNNVNEKKKFDAKYPAPPPPPAPALQPIEVRGYKSSAPVAVEGKPLPENLIYVINGKISTKYEMEQLKPEQIASVDILKGNPAVALYGDNAKDGVVQIKLKDEAKPLYVIDGEIATKEKMDQLKPEQIEAIDVLKGEKATAAYGDKGKNGVIVIRTKK